MCENYRKCLDVFFAVPSVGYGTQTPHGDVKKYINTLSRVLTHKYMCENSRRCLDVFFAVPSVGDGTQTPHGTHETAHGRDGSLHGRDGSPHGRDGSLHAFSLTPFRVSYE